MFGRAQVCRLNGRAGEDIITEIVSVASGETMGERGDWALFYE